MFHRRFQLSDFSKTWFLGNRDISFTQFIEISSFCWSDSFIQFYLILLWFYFLLFGFNLLLFPLKNMSATSPVGEHPSHIAKKRTIIKDRLGCVRTSTYTLPGDDFTYGAPTLEASENCADSKDV
jgi:hypothetical protein